MQFKEEYCHICKSKCQKTLCKNCYVPLFTDIEHHISFAFNQDLKEIDYLALHNSKVLDYFKCGIIKAEFSNFSQLRQLRLSHCKNLTKIELKDLPNLVSLDVFYAPNLTEFKISNVPNLIALDLSYCQKLTEIEGDFSKIEYFSISYSKISKLPSLPNVKFVDISSTKINDIKPLQSSQKLQKLISLDNYQIETIHVCQLIHLPNFTSIATSSILDFKDCPTKHPLKNIYCHKTPMNADHIDFSHTNLDPFVTLKQPHLSFERPIPSGDWYESYRLLYGPYPTAPNDIKPFLSSAEAASIRNIYPLPANVDPKRASFHIMGALFGTAVGDCLGMFCECKDTVKINFFNDQPLDITWTHPIKFKYCLTLHRGGFTDDTALMLTFLRSVVSTAIKNHSKSSKDVNNIFDVCEAARRIKHWINCGIDEHLDEHGYGSGSSTTGVVRSDGYADQPIQVSRSFWDANGRKRASNGGVMRTAGCGCFFFWDEPTVITVSRRFCQITHYDPRCVFSSVLVSVLVSRLIRWRCGLLQSFDLHQTISDVKSHFTWPREVTNSDDDQIDFIENFADIDPFLRAEEVEELRLEDKEVPRTLNTMGCAVWVLRKNFGYQEGIEKVIRAGGDTDTNAAVAGAVLGAKWGFCGIPLHVLDFMWYGGILYRDAQPFLQTMGMDFKPPSYDDMLSFRYLE